MEVTLYEVLATSANDAEKDACERSCVRGEGAPEPMAPIPRLRHCPAVRPACRSAAPAGLAAGEPRARFASTNDERSHYFSAERPEPEHVCGGIGQFADRRAVTLKRPFAARFTGADAAVPLTGEMGDFGEGPLGTKLGQGATAVKYPRPTRVKNKTPAPTQVRPRAAARRAFSSRLVEISPPSSARVFPASESFLPLSTLADLSSSPPPPFSRHLAVRVHRSPRSRSCARRRSTRRRISRRPR